MRFFSTSTRFIFYRDDDRYGSVLNFGKELVDWDEYYAPIITSSPQNSAPYIALHTLTSR